MRESVAPTDAAPDQAVILVGGLGTRLGPLGAARPKPLLEVGGRPFVEYLVESCLRFGFRDILLLASHQAAQVARYVEGRRKRLPAGTRLGVSVEDAPRGTAGAVRHALDRLAGRFLLLNGDSIFDVNWLDLVLLAAPPGPMLAMALCGVTDTGRFGVVELEGERVVSFARRGQCLGGLINAGVYLVDRSLVIDFPPSGSLEELVLPRLAARGLLRGRAYDGFFIDIGVPSAFEAAQSALPLRRERPAVFFDRDGTVVVDNGYVYRPEDLAFLPGAVEAVKRVNDLGSYAFLVTNQAGVARGLFTEADVIAFNAELQRRLRAAGAHFDDVRYCPYHPEGTVEAYRRRSDWRKPAPGMLLDLMGHWPVRRDVSWVVGDKASDVAAAAAAGLRSMLYQGGDLDALLARNLLASADQ
jgi:D,D-heptose 1,7-bisphosphate phosphatase